MINSTIIDKWDSLDYSEKLELSLKHGFNIHNVNTKVLSSIANELELV